MSEFRLTDEQKAILRECMNSPISEKELCEKLGIDEKTFAETEHDDKREIVLNQVLSDDELEAAAGGKFRCIHLMRLALCGLNGSPYPYPCEDTNYRPIYEPAFPNCAATVEDGSWCLDSDACYDVAIVYEGMRECHKSWK